MRENQKWFSLIGGPSFAGPPAPIPGILGFSECAGALTIVGDQKALVTAGMNPA